MTATLVVPTEWNIISIHPIVIATLTVKQHLFLDSLLCICTREMLSLFVFPLINLYTLNITQTDRTERE